MLTENTVTLDEKELATLDELLTLEMTKLIKNKRSSKNIDFLYELRAKITGEY